MDFPDNLRVTCDTCHTVTFRHTKSQTESQQPRPGEEQQILSGDSSDGSPGLWSGQLSVAHSPVP